MKNTDLVDNWAHKFTGRDRVPRSVRELVTRWVVHAKKAGHVINMEGYNAKGFDPRTEATFGFGVVSKTPPDRVFCSRCIDWYADANGEGIWTGEKMTTWARELGQEIDEKKRKDKHFFWVLTGVAALIAIVGYASGLLWLTFLAAGAYIFLLCRAFVIWLNLRVDDLRDKLKSQEDCVRALERRVGELEGERRNYGLRTE